MSNDDDDAQARRVREIRDRLAAALAAHPLPWESIDGDIRSGYGTEDERDVLSCCNIEVEALRYIAASVTDIPWLLARVDALTTQRDALQQRVASLEVAVRKCSDWFGVPVGEFVLRWGGDWLTASNDDMAAELRVALAAGTPVHDGQSWPCSVCDMPVTGRWCDGCCAPICAAHSPAKRYPHAPSAHEAAAGTVETTSDA